MRGKVLVVHSDEISAEEFIEKNQAFVNAAKRNNIFLEFKSNEQIYSYIDNNIVKCHDTFGTFNYAFFFDKDVWLARNLEMMGVKVVNSSRAIDLCENKANMYQELAKHNVNIPKTVIFPTLSEYTEKKALHFINEAISDLGLPIVVKEWIGDAGRNVYLAKNRQELIDIVNRLKGRQILFQEFILEASGSDIRMFIIKNKVVAAIRRQGLSGDFRSNLSLGGTMYNYIPTYNDEKLAIEAAKAVGCDFAIVDILKSINGPVVCEVNTTANVNNFSKTCDVDIPDLLLRTLK